MRRHVFDTREELAKSLARRVSDALRKGLDERDAASLAISGGSTPGRFLDALSRERIDWPKVVVTLVDERFVPPSSDRSNERLARERLLKQEARLARFVPLYCDASKADEAARAAEAGIALMPKPFDAVILGMGTDGHTASFFPDAANLAELVDPDGRRLVVAVEAASAGEARLTLTLPLLANARLLALHIEGQEKSEVFDAALASGGPPLPIRSVADATPQLELYWAP